MKYPILILSGIKWLLQEINNLNKLNNYDINNQNNEQNEGEEIIVNQKERILYIKILEFILL